MCFFFFFGVGGCLGGKPEEMEQKPRQNTKTNRQTQTQELPSKSPLCSSFPFFILSDSDMICLSKDNTRVCSCQRGEIIYSIKSQVRADKQTGWMFIYETSRWRGDMAGGGLSAPQDPPVAASFTLRFIRFWFAYFQINYSFMSGNHSLTRESWKFFLFFHFLQRQEKQFRQGLIVEFKFELSSANDFCCSQSKTF